MGWATFWAIFFKSSSDDTAGIGQLKVGAGNPSAPQ
jgi:hypothetical protein